ncbi:MAG: hypothetical protein RBT44_01515 [Sphaerochaetaceae bacterium]|jgi:hypothetical protein|nr:hypothetical protein [Sphaerochaetaceae bacterium]
MQKHRESSPVGIIAVSAIITIAVLVLLSYLFVRHLMPMYDLSIETIYSILVRLLPISIGIVLVLIAMAIAPPRIPKDTDEDDMIPKDEYTAPLYTLPSEEEPIGVPLSLERATSAKEVPPPPVPQRFEEPMAPAIRKFESKLRDVRDMERMEIPPELRFEEESPVEVELPSPVLDEANEPEAAVPFVEEAEVPVIEPEVDREVADIHERLSRAVLFGEYPYQVDPESDIGKLLEPIGETATAELPESYHELLEDTFESRLEEELGEAKNLGYDITVASITFPSQGSDPHSVDATVVQSLFNKLGITSFFYLTDETSVGAILPFYGFSQARRYFASLLESLRKQHAKSAVQIGFACLSGRDLDTGGLLREVSLAAEIATQQGGFSLIGYDDALEEESGSLQT